ncbi:MAG: metallophosphoesterase [Acidobacteria bacterium]|nr:metallophosphoesterase [Acidobacteriota bacterium]MBI3657255.1 metallophosphoesterase [Acidobacteriota bacterium]
MDQQKESQRAPRTLVVGDVHGCYAELMDLLDKAALRGDDRIVFVGDLINRGPHNRKVLEFVQATRQTGTVIGNHEFNLLRYYQGHTHTLKSSYHKVINELGADYRRHMDFIAKLPLTIELDEAVVLHAGLRPGVSLDHQDPWEVVNLRGLPPTGRPWYEFYTGKKPIIFGHWVRQHPLVLKNVIGLDTGCVYGGKLSAVLLPSYNLISIPARRIYAHKPAKCVQKNKAEV